MSLHVKICGLKTEEMIRAAAAAGADSIGFVFFEKSPRYLTMGEAMKLRRAVPEGVWVVALLVDPDNALLDDLVTYVHPDVIQLHGKESPQRVAEIRARTHIPVMKAIAVSGPEDVTGAEAYEPFVDMLLFDAKPPKTMAGALPGGNGLAFDWELIGTRKPRKPWMLSGGLTPLNVAEAIRTAGATMVDVSSGVESAPGEKDAALVEAFIRAAKQDADMVKVKE
ncbi:phosphoribosylanthranilate isomerase [Tepidicaulis marinus]|uniref:N-(5'-phosphoribosyl)anthranilate isomerase n=1 Tax=Tepidicaulis marinus TaxID=1333998 RepID=A0A081BE53_9HYPH|nr:phosphoribosylanthranilate isomerase [Tepidicaulis marinus]GAK46321.1 phosphoribosylanthranilate isomerase [Tepidicaulis marinus]